MHVSLKTIKQTGLPIEEDATSDCRSLWTVSAPAQCPPFCVLRGQADDRVPLENSFESHTSQ